MSFIIAQIVGGIALLLSVIGLQKNNGKKFLLFQTLINGLYIIQYFLLSATAGLSMCLINTVRCLVFYYYKKEDKKGSYFLLLLFLTLYIYLGIYTINSIFDIVLIVGTLIYTYSLWQSRMKIIRLGALAGIVSYIFYNIAVKAYSALLLDFIDLISISVAILRYDIVKTKASNKRA